MHQLSGLAATTVVALLTSPAFVRAWKTHVRPRGGYIQLGRDEVGYQDPDGVATEDSIRAFTDTRARIAFWLGAATGLAASIAVKVVGLKSLDYTDTLTSLDAWAEPACWVRIFA